MNWNMLLIKGSLIILDLGRALIVLGMIAGLIITIFQDTGETLSLDLSGRFKSTEMNVIRVRPEYQDLIKDIEISPVTYRISARMGKFQRPLLIGIMFFVIIYSFFHRTDPAKLGKICRCQLVFFIQECEED